MKHVLPFAMALASFAVLAPAHAEDVVAGKLTILQAHAAATLKGQMSDAGYLEIRNDGDTPDTLLGMKAGFAVLQLHETKVDANGVSTMRPVEKLVIPAHQTIKFETGGYHIMMMGLKAPLKAGAHERATLLFEHAGEVTIDFAITGKGDAMGAMDMGAATGN